MALSIRTIGVLAVSTILLVPPSAFAQDVGALPIPIAEVSGGYVFMRDTDIEESFPGGWYFSGAVNATRWFGIVGEVSGSYKKLDETFDNLPIARFQVYTFLGGPRFFGQVGRFVPFAQVLAGAAHRRVKMTFPPELRGPSVMRLSATDFAIQPGGGVTVFLSDRVGLRLAADYRYLKEDDEWEFSNEFRALAGFTFGWGAR